MSDGCVNHEWNCVKGDGLREGSERRESLNCAACWGVGVEEVVSLAPGATVVGKGGDG